METKSIAGKGPFTAMRHAVAVELGSDRALMLQTLAWHCNRNRETEEARFKRDGFWWCQFSYADLAAMCPYWSIGKIRRMVSELRDAGLVHCRQRGQSAMWHAVDFEAVDELCDGVEDGPVEVGEGVPELTPRVSKMITQEDEVCSKIAPCAIKNDTQGAQNDHARCAELTPCAIKNDTPLITRDHRNADKKEGRGHARENSEPEPAPLPAAIDRSEIERKRKELDEIESEESLDVYLIKLSSFYEVPFPVPSALRVAGEVIGAVGVDSARPYIREKMSEYAQRGFDARLSARFLVQDAAEWKQKRAERASTHKNETNASGGESGASVRAERREVSPTGFDWDARENAKVIINDAGEIKPYWERQWREHFYMRTAWEFQKIQRLYGDEQMRRAARWMRDNDLPIEGEIRDPETFDPAKVIEESLPDDDIPF